MKRGCYSAFIVMAFFFITGNASAANIIVNGSFEYGDTSNFNSSYKTVMAGDTSITGWTVNNMGVNWHNNVELKNPQDGDLLVDFNLNGPSDVTLSQSFATETGVTYNLAFWLAAPDLNDSINVGITGTNDTLFTQAASSSSNLVWGQKSLVFTATGAITTLTFSNSAQTGYYWGPLLDNVSVEKTSPAVPIPAAVWLLGSGLLGLIGFRRKLN